MATSMDISHLTPAQRLALIDTLWDSLAADSDLRSLPVPPQHMAELDRRLDALDLGEMEAGEPWETVSKRLGGNEFAAYRCAWQPPPVEGAQPLTASRRNITRKYPAGGRVLPPIPPVFRLLSRR